jgi:uncharacterized protein
VRVYLDTNVLVYAFGAESPHRDPCREILRAVAERRLAGETSAYTVQEFVRQRRRRGDRQAAARARSAIDVCTELHPVDGVVIRRALEIVDRYPKLDIADAVHVATASTHRVTMVLSADRGLDGISEIERVDPLDRGRLAALTSE